MGNNVTPDFLRGFIIPMELGSANIWQSETTITQQNPSAGDPVPQQTSKMRVLSNGVQSDTGNLSIVTRKAGSAGFGSRFTFKENVSSTTVEYGRDSYNAISGFEYKLTGSLTTNYRLPTALVTKANTLIIAYEEITALTTELKVLRIDKDGTESTTTEYTVLTALTTTQRLHPTITELEDGAIMLGHLLEDDGKANFRVLRSEDDGVSFDLVSREGWNEALAVGTATGAGVATFDIIRMRMASVSGSTVLLVETESNNTSVTKRNQVFQYVSIDGCGTFTKISTASNLTSNSYRKINLSTRFGRFVFSYIATTGTLQYMELPNPFSNIHLLREAGAVIPLLSVPNASTGTNDYMTGGDTAMVVDEDGGVYVYAYNGGTNDFIVSQYYDGVQFRYTNGSETVAQGSTLNCDDALTRLRDIFVVHWLGRGFMVSNMDSSTSLDNSILFTYLGGYSNQNLPKTAYGDVEADWTRAGFIRNYLPLDEPSNITGLNETGLGNDVISGGALVITSSPSYPSNRFYTWNNLPTSLINTDYTDQGIIVRSSCIATDGGGTTANQRGFTLEMDNGTNRYKIAIYITETSILLRDIIGSSDIATNAHDNTQGVDIICSIGKGNKVSAWFRTASNTSLRNYSNIATNQTITSAGSTSAGHRIEWGHLTYTSGTFKTNWKEFHVSTLGATGIGLANGFDNPNDLASRPYPPLSQWAYVYDGVSISTTDGPTYEGEQFQITPQYDYPVENIFFDIAPSPRIQWRTAKVTGFSNVPSQTLSIKLNSDTATSIIESLPNDLMGFHFSGVNWRLGDIYYHNGTTWVQLASIANQIRSSCVITGRSVRGAVGLTEPYFTLNELAGWTAYFVVGLDQVYRKVVSNTEGKFGGTATGTKQCTVQFLTNPPQGAGTVYFIPPMFSVVVSMNGIQASAFQIRTDAQRTYDNDIRIGEVIIGPVILAGRQYGRGRTISIESGTTTIETQDGIRYSREIKPPTRSFNVAWTDGIDISQLQGSQPDIDYWMASNQTGAQPIAVNNEAPDLMMGFLRYVQGAKKHFVYLPNISKSTSASEDKRYLGRENQQALVTLVGDVQIEHVVGDELQSQSGEVFRIATITMKEVK
jgi:hypothetical protein